MPRTIFACVAMLLCFIIGGIVDDMGYNGWAIQGGGLFLFLAIMLRGLKKDKSDDNE